MHKQYVKGVQNNKKNPAYLNRPVDGPYYTLTIPTKKATHQKKGKFCKLHYIAPDGEFPLMEKWGA